MARLNIKTDLSALLIAGIILAGIGWVFSRKPLGLVKQNQSVHSSNNTNETNDFKTQNNPGLTAGYLYVVTEKNSSKQIVSINLNDSTQKTIYTDSDEKSKLIGWIGVEQNKVIAMEAENKQSESGRLITISIDKKATKVTLQEEININNKPTYDKSSGQLLLIDFSPAERDFGFIISAQKLDGTSRRTILKNINGISGLTSFDDKIFFGQLADKQTKVFVYDWGGNKLNEAIINGVLIDSEWINNKILLSTSPPGSATANQAEISIYSEELTKNEKTIAKRPGSKVNITHISTDLIAYLNVQYKNGVIASGVEGDVILSNINTGEEKNIGNAIGIIGYNNE